MLLRRITEHAKAQNWTAIGIDLVIVVIGVFIGIQASNLNQDLALDRQERIHLERLLVDTEQMLSSAEAGSIRRAGHINNIVSGLNALQTCTSDETARRALDGALKNHQGLSRLLVVRVTYDEMVASGMIARIDDIALKDTIASTFAMAESHQGFIEYISDDLGRASDIIWRKVAFGIELKDAGAPTKIESFRAESATQTIDYDFDTLCNDPVFRNALLEVLDSSSDRQIVAEEFIAKLQSLRSSLTRRLEA